MVSLEKKKIETTLNRKTDAINNCTEIFKSFKRILTCGMRIVKKTAAASARTCFGKHIDEDGKKK